MLLCGRKRRNDDDDDDTNTYMFGFQKFAKKLFVTIRMTDTFICDVCVWSFVPLRRFMNYHCVKKVGVSFVNTRFDTTTTTTTTTTNGGIQCPLGNLPLYV